jgi:hypothetical protein
MYKYISIDDAVDFIASFDKIHFRRPNARFAKSGCSLWALVDKSWRKLSDGDTPLECV